MKRLHPFLPPPSHPLVDKLYHEFPIPIRVKKARKTKLGDYRPPHQGKPATISINNNLNPFAFLITLLHEYAHHFTWMNYEEKAAPHGKEWKVYYVRLIRHFLERGVFPKELEPALIKHISNPASSSCYDVHLSRELRRYDSPGVKQMIEVLESLPEGSLFEYGKGRVFEKRERLRKRYKCFESKTGRIYLFHPLAEVKPLDRLP
ncbi:MAG: SprT-like domain-containing protein [Bacteroidota bacterium]|nr:SprT-like domain-containing protein [Bacteroidota bacterium]MDX5404054.1 SprT-like domain-containing protein [Bacteroidota bacterium]MDX5428552.1 SprT-like domain-containing protein [Bacteroidota bacterium]MDX5447119.1 SprT-like domain-containing protein [Bacteroidota bacterium]MDX5506311.1 SprT-like domain-containing protein [Bacteroidota bacterium]